MTAGAPRKLHGLPSVVVPQLRPFRGLRYDPARVPDLGAVLCPPYDVISSAERQALIARDEHNAVRLELPGSYAEAASLLEAWQGNGVLRRDERPLIYVYEQRFTLGEDDRVARSFFCRLRLEDYGPGSGVRTLSDSDRVVELARMLAGLDDTETGRAHAEELLATATAERQAAAS